MLNIFSLFSEQIALLEGIDVLLRDSRPVEAMFLLRSLMLGACQLESIADHSNPIGVAIRIKLDTLARQAALYESESMITDRISDQIARFRSKAIEINIEIPGRAPDIHDTNFFAKNANSLRFVDEIALPSDLAATLHATTDDAGNKSITTRTMGPNLLTGVAIDAVDAMTSSAIATAKALNWPIDDALVETINADMLRMSEGGNE